MDQRSVLHLAFLGILSFTTGCGQSATSTLDSYPAGQIDTAAHVGHFTGSSAGYIGTLFAGTGQGDTHTAASCPSAEVNGETRTVNGGNCTDDGGSRYTGSYTTVHDPAADTYETTFHGFADDTVSECMPTNGGAAVMVHTIIRYDGVVRAGNKDRPGSFHVDLDIDADAPSPTDCVVRHVTSAIVYDGSWTTGDDANHDGHPDRYVWNGSGRIGDSEAGTVSATTTDETIDGTICNTEALSGRTTITSGGHTAVITYDGATDCSRDATVTWTYDGAAQGTLTGVACSVTRPGGSSRGAGFTAVVALAALGSVLARRRRSA